MHYSKALTLLAALTFTLVLPSTAQAQQRGNWTVDARTGFTVLTGDLSNLENRGLNAAVGISRRVGSAVAFRVDASVEKLNGKDGSADGVLVPEGVPDMTLTSLHVGVDLLQTPTDQRRWGVTVNFEIGATRMKTDDDPIFQAESQPSANYSKTFFSALTGMHFDYRVAPHVDLTVGGEVHFIGTGKENTAVFTKFSSLVEDGGFRNAWSFPVQVGVKVGL